MAQPSMPFGVFRGKRLDEWNWYIADPRAGDIATTIEQWRAANDSSNKPAWRRVLFWIVFAIVIVVVGVVIPLFFWSAREVGTYGFMLLAGLLTGITGAWRLDSLFGEPQSPPLVEGVARLDPNLESWVRDTMPVADVWDLNVEVSGAVALELLSLQANDPSLTTGILDVIDEKRDEQFARVRDVGARVGYDIPQGGFELDDE